MNKAECPENIRGVLERVAARGVADKNTTKKSGCDHERAARIRLWNAAQCPERHKRFRLENATGEHWKAIERKIRGMVGEGFLLSIHGKRGVGKTQLGVMAIRHACYKLRTSLYIRAPMMFMELRSGYGGTGNEISSLKRFLDPKMLVIDMLEEMNASSTGFEPRMLTILADLRYGDCKDTILITNEVPESFVKTAGHSIAARIMETGEAIRCDWNSYRN